MTTGFLNLTRCFQAFPEMIRTMGSVPSFDELLERYGNTSGFVIGAVMVVLLVLASPAVKGSRVRGVLSVFAMTVLLNALDSACAALSGLLSELLFREGLTEAELLIGGAFNPLSLFLLTMILCTAYKTAKNRGFFFGLIVFGITILLNDIWAIPETTLWFMIGRVVLAAVLCRAVAGYKYPFVAHLTMGLYFLITEAVTANFCYGIRFFEGRSALDGLLAILYSYRVEVVWVLGITVLMLLFEAYVLEDKATRWRDMKAGTVPAVLIIALAALGGMFYADMKVDAREALVMAETAEEETEELQIVYDIHPLEGEIEVSSSSFLTSQTGLVFPVANLIDGDPVTSWQEGVRGTGVGEYAVLSFERTLIGGLDVLNGSHQYEERYYENGRPTVLEVTYFLEGTSICTETIFLEDAWSEEPQSFLREENIDCDSVQLRILEVSEGTRYRDTAIAEVRLYEAVPKS